MGNICDFGASQQRHWNRLHPTWTTVHCVSLSVPAHMTHLHWINGSLRDPVLALSCLRNIAAQYSVSLMGLVKTVMDMLMTITFTLVVIQFVSLVGLCQWKHREGISSHG